MAAEAPSRRGPKTLVSPSLVSDSLMAVGDQFAQAGEIERLGDEIEGAEFERAHGGFHVAVRGDHRDRHARGVLLHPLDQIQPVAVGQLHVGQTQIEALGLEQPLRGARRLCAVRGVKIHALQRDGQELAEIGFVVDDQNGGLGHGCHCSLSGRVRRYSSQRCGSLNTIRNTLPPPVRGSYSRMARFSWHSSRAMNRPSPVPPLRPVKNGSKMRSAALASIPVPRSATSRKGR